jgi:general L-amino acid transport system permease protein
MATGQRFKTFQVGAAILIGLPLAVFVLTGAPLTFEMPELRGFNFVGGFAMKPEFIALLLGLTLYTATYIAEIVRAGILAVSHGQTEAASSLGLRNGETLRLVVIPQAMRVIIPPLTSQYLNLTKNSSLAVAIGYPDLVSVFSGTVLNQTGQAIEVISITMLIYLTISLVTALFMNWFNRRFALVER